MISQDWAVMRRTSKNLKTIGLYLGVVLFLGVILLVSDFVGEPSGGDLPTTEGELARLEGYRCASRIDTHKTWGMLQSFGLSPEFVEVQVDDPEQNQKLQEATYMALSHLPPSVVDLLATTGLKVVITKDVKSMCQ